MRSGLAIAHAHGCGGGDGLEGVTALVVPGITDGLGEVAVLLHERRISGAVGRLALRCCRIKR